MKFVVYRDGIHILPIFLKSNAIFSWLKINRITKQKLKYHSKILKINPKFTENHLFLLSLIKQEISGKDADAALGKAFITVNKNSVPNDPRSPFVTSGLRFGTPAVTTRGFKVEECRELANWICDILADINNEAVIDAVREKVKAICAKLPVYGN